MTTNVPAPESGFVDAADGVKLYHELHAPEGGLGGARGLVLVAHGYADHCGRYGFLRESLLAQGWAAALFDYRGHGKAGGRRGFVERFEEYHSDLDAVLGLFRARAQGAGKRLFVLGHSHGGLIVLHRALAAGGIIPAVAGLVLTNPFLGLALQVPGWKVAVARALSGVWPSFAMPNELDPHTFTHDEAVVAAHGADHLVGRNATARWFTECRRAQQEVRDRAAEITAPYLLLIGGADRVADPDVERRFHAATGSADKDVEEYAGLFHELHNEAAPDRARVFTRLCEWLAAKNA
jgi:lysophospholipase